MDKVFLASINRSAKPYIKPLKNLLNQFRFPFKKGQKIGLKLHWGERGNKGFLPPDYAKEIVTWLQAKETHPFVFDTTVLYSGGRRTAEGSLTTAARHGYTPDFLGCPLVIADGMDGRHVVSIPAGYKHFKTVEVGNVFSLAQGFVIFSHFKGHMVALFGGAVKNISMGFASRAQKQRMHSDYHPVLNKKKCTRCGLCVQVCPAKAASQKEGDYPLYDLKKCIGCAQCIALCPELALQIFWNTNKLIFQEKLVETAAAVWEKIKGRTLVINALLNITAECDCLPGHHPTLRPDYGFIGGYHPILVDIESLKLIGPDTFERVHPGIPWQRQFSYAHEIGFSDQPSPWKS